jgi:hypothetical protein
MGGGKDGRGEDKNGPGEGSDAGAGEERAVESRTDSGIGDTGIVEESPELRVATREFPRLELVSIPGTTNSKVCDT